MLYLIATLLVAVVAYFILKQRSSAAKPPVVKEPASPVTNTETGEVTFHSFQKSEPVDIEETRLLSKRFWTDYYLSGKPHFYRREQYCLLHAGRKYTLDFQNGEPASAYSFTADYSARDSGMRELKAGSKLHLKLLEILKSELEKVESGALAIEIQDDGERGKEAYLQRIAELEAKKAAKTAPPSEAAS